MFDKLERFTQEDANDKLCHSKSGKYTVGYVTLPSSDKKYTKVSEATKVMFVLAGEMDVVVNGMNIRLSKDSWINIPKGIEYTVSIYRSKDPCTFFSISILEDCEDKKLNYGNLKQLPKYNDIVSYFGQESGLLQGMFLKLTKDSDSWTAKLNNESFIYCYSGSIKVFTKREMVSLEKGEFTFPKRRQQFTVASKSDEAEFMIFSTPIDNEKIDEYIAWLKTEYGILWEEGVCKVEKSRNIDQLMV